MTLTLTAIEAEHDQPHAGPCERFLRLPMHAQMTQRMQQLHAMRTNAPTFDRINSAAKAFLTALELDIGRWAEDCECAATEVLAMQRELDRLRRKPGWRAWSGVRLIEINATIEIVLRNGRKKPGGKPAAEGGEPAPALDLGSGA